MLPWEINGLKLTYQDIKISIFRRLDPLKLPKCLLKRPKFPNQVPAQRLQIVVQQGSHHATIPGQLGKGGASDFGVATLADAFEFENIKPSIYSISIT
jgi:hypothetical protein